MILKDLLEKDFGVELPISGGFGNSIENAVIIHKEGINDYVGIESPFLNLSKSKFLDIQTWVPMVTV
jgi:hypothetical protein